MISEMTPLTKIGISVTQVKRGKPFIDTARAQHDFHPVFFCFSCFCLVFTLFLHRHTSFFFYNTQTHLCFYGRYLGFPKGLQHVYIICSPYIYVCIYCESHACTATRTRMKCIQVLEYTCVCMHDFVSPARPPLLQSIYHPSLPVLHLRSFLVVKIYRQCGTRTNRIYKLLLIAWGAKLNRTYGTYNIYYIYIYISQFLLTLFRPYLLWSPVIIGVLSWVQKTRKNRNHTRHPVGIGN